MFAGDLKKYFPDAWHWFNIWIKKKNHKTFKFEELNVKEKNCKFVPDWFFFLGGVVKCALFKFWTQADLIDKAKITTPLKMVMLFQQYLHSLNTLSK